MWKKYVGTVGITAVGMFGKGAGWGIPPALPTLMLTVGGIGEKPGVVDGQIVMRDYLSLTISFDHDMIDGAPAARFTERLKELIESGYGLFDSTVESELAITPETSRKSEHWFAVQGGFLAWEPPAVTGVRWGSSLLRRPGEGARRTSVCSRHGSRGLWREADTTLTGGKLCLQL